MEVFLYKVRMKFLRRLYVIAHRFQFQAKQRKETRAIQRTLLMHKSFNSRRKSAHWKACPANLDTSIFKAAQDPQPSSCNSLVWFLLHVERRKFCRLQKAGAAANSSKQTASSWRPNLIKKQPQQHTWFHMTAMFSQSSPADTKRKVVPSFLLPPVSKKVKFYFWSLGTFVL